MSLTPEYGESEVVEGREQRIEGRVVQGDLAPGSASASREMMEHELAERELLYVDAEGNEAHAAGEICERCGGAITPNQDVRKVVSGRWIHEVCPHRIVAS
jgi:hypothetical protein